MRVLAWVSLVAAVFALYVGFTLDGVGRFAAVMLCFVLACLGVFLLLTARQRRVG